MRTVLVLLPLALLACKPPKEIIIPVDTGLDAPPAEPLIEIVHPQNGSEVELEDDCSLDTVVAVQIEDFELVSFTDFPTPAEGEGHWHVQVSGDPSYAPVESGQSVEIVRPGFIAGPFSITVNLVDSQHQPIGVGQDEFFAELTAVAPYGVTCN